jgi:predicted glycosyltransferase
MKKKRIWIDIDNSPHVLFFDPIVRRLRAAGHEVLITARACAQTHALLELHDMPFEPIGRHYGKNLPNKVYGLGARAVQLYRRMRRQQIDVAVSHGSRSLVTATYLMRIACVTLYDYEYVFTKLFNLLSTKVLIPELIPDETLRSIGLDDRKTAKYPGFKEEVYLADFQPDERLYDRLGISRDSVLVTIRPPAMDAHYHHPGSERLFEAALSHIASQQDVVAIVLPRNESQREAILHSRAGRPNLIVPDRPLDGLNLIWNSDLVISGGGTMNREAALLGTPVYSIFSGKRGALDRRLVETGRLHFLRDVEDITNLPLHKRTAKPPRPPNNEIVIDTIVREILTTS